MNDLRNHARGPGAAGFSLQYWEENYAEPATMDGIYNARRQAAALKAQFDAEYVEIGSLIDFGFGLGYLFRAMIDAFLPHTVVGIEPSAHAFAQVEKQQLSTIESTEITLLPVDILTWCQQTRHAADEPFDLGICTSVFQYLSDPEMARIVPILAQRVKYLYFTVPTDVELQYQSVEFDYVDRYALSRTRDEYRAALGEHFTIVSNRLLESKVHFDEDTSSFNDLVFRF